MDDAVTTLERDEDGVIVGEAGLALLRQIRERRGLVTGPCFECGKDTLPLPAVLRGQPEALCPSCSEARSIARQSAEVRAAAARHRASGFAGRVAHAGLASQQRILDALGVSVVDQRGRLRADQRRGEVPARAVLRYLGTREPGLLILSGDTGEGKSTAAAWAAWSTGGVSYERSRWSTLPEFGQVSPEDLDLMLGLQGVLVLDDVWRVRGDGKPGDTNSQAELVFQIGARRHEAKRPTILTTQATSDQIVAAYGTSGAALLRRAQDGLDDNGAPLTGGFVNCTIR